jgi:hypothetical protein
MKQGPDENSNALHLIHPQFPPPPHLRRAGRTGNLRLGAKESLRMRTTEQIAPETLSSYIAQLTQPTTEQPTTAELEEALTQVVPCIGHVLRTWISSRHLIGAQAVRAAEFRESHPALATLVTGIPTETEAEKAELDRIEAASPVVLGRLA